MSDIIPPWVTYTEAFGGNPPPMREWECQCCPRRTWSEATPECHGRKMQPVEED